MHDVETRGLRTSGLLTEDYFMYAEDIDLNHKIRKLGFSSYYVGEAKIVHHGGRSSSQQRVSQWSTVMTYRAMLTFYRKSRGRMYGAAYRVAMGLFSCCAVDSSRTDVSIWRQAWHSVGCGKMEHDSEVVTWH